MPDFDISRGGCRVEVREREGNHYVHWVKNQGEPLDYFRALKATKKEASRLGIKELYFFIDPSDVRLILLYDRAGATTEAVVMKYEVSK